MTQIFETHRDSFTLSTDPNRLDMDTVNDFLSRAYWAKGRPHERTEEAFANSLVFGIYAGSRQIGMARVVTDYSIIAYLCDVFIHEDYRGHGLGKWLVQSVLNHPQLKQVRRWLLATNDAHGLYQHFDFELLNEPEKWMHRLRPFAGE
ncbi:MAG: GNAT family N-acetyltransferase [Anaerolineales bacterium]|uniref:GNAT family N-acetyltransferase n=1 Tax=Candidatus Villigracilis proximus TaxID=3140683 RepID=UPI0031373263|nr:GNAT family N-acetyltransferase [Anaerolineales bacterium]